MIQLYDYILSGSCYKVRLFLSMLGKEFEPIPVDYYPGGEHKTPEFLEINPLGQIPILRDGDLTLRDAQAILVYLAGRYDTGRTWYPEDAETQGQIAMWLSFAVGEIMNSSAARLHDMLFYDFDIDKVRAAARAAFRVLDDHLTEREIDGADWIVGDAPTIADIACFPYVALSADGGILLDDYNAIRRWIARFKTIPGFIIMPGIHAN